MDSNPTENYYSNTVLSITPISELQCTFTIHKLDSHITPKDCVRIYVDIDYNVLYDEVSYQPALDLTYTVDEYQNLIDNDLLLDNLKMHYLQNEATSRDFDEYYH